MRWIREDGVQKGWIMPEGTEIDIFAFDVDCQFIDQVTTAHICRASDNGELHLVVLDFGGKNENMRFGQRRK